MGGWYLLAIRWEKSIGIESSRKIAKSVCGRSAAGEDLHRYEHSRSRCNRRSHAQRECVLSLSGNPVPALDAGDFSSRTGRGLLHPYRNAISSANLTSGGVADYRRKRTCVL